jgi:hypothetical protein
MFQIWHAVRILFKDFIHTSLSVLALHLDIVHVFVFVFLLLVARAT